ncbi:MAG: PAS domain-containing protein [Balneolaceae bacterium]|nr:PAS domain-containing protein [Balneolaceae bacterium]
MANLVKQLRSRRGNIAIILVFVVLALFMIIATHYGTKTLSAVRAYVGAEGQWTKAQKEATILLIQYSATRQPELYQQFQKELGLHKAFKRARQTLISDHPDYELAFKGFQTADIHPGDTDLLIWLGQFHKDISYLQQAFDIWKQGDQKITELDSLGHALHQAIEEDLLDSDTRNQFIRDISTLDTQLTKLESSFSATMTDGARWIRTVLFWSIVTLGVIIIITGYFITRSYFKNINNLNKELKENEDKFKKVLQNSRDLVYQLNFETGEYEYVSPAVKSILGYSPDQLIDEGPNFILDRIHPEDLKRIDQEVEEMKGKGVKDHFAGETEYRIKKADGDYIWISNQRSLVEDDRGNPKALVGSVRNISDRKQHEMDTHKSLKEKQTLLEEIHHRVKNNLAVVSSLLELQKNESSDEVRPILQDTQSRIHSIAMIHEKLYQTKTLSDIDMREYIEDFTKMIARSFGSDQKDITITQQIQPFTLEITKAVPVGLILNELLNNAFKHGFANARNGVIRITLTKENGRGTLRVADNGQGLPDDFSLDNQQSLGMTLIQTLTKQLEGEFEILPGDKWTIFQVKFPVT